MPAIGIGVGIPFLTGGGSLLAKLFGDQYFADWDPALPSRRVETYLDGAGEKVTNGAFAADTDWTKGTGWTIAGGVAVATGVLAAAYLEQTCLTVGATYAITFTVTASANTCTPYAGTQAGVAAGAGTHTQIIVANGTALKFGGHASGFTGTIDNVSAVELPACDVLNEPGCRARMLADPTVLDACDLVAASHATALKYQEGGWSGDGKGCLVALGGQYGTADALAGKVSGDLQSWGAIAACATSTTTGLGIICCAASSSSVPKDMYRRNATGFETVHRNDAGSSMTASWASTIAADTEVVITSSKGSANYGYKNAVADSNNPLSVKSGQTTLDTFAVGAIVNSTFPSGGNFWEGFFRRVVVLGSHTQTPLPPAASHVMSQHGVTP